MPGGLGDGAEKTPEQLCRDPVGTPTGYRSCGIDHGEQVGRLTAFGIIHCERLFWNPEGASRTSGFFFPCGRTPGLGAGLGGGQGLVTLYSFLHLCTFA